MSSSLAIVEKKPAFAGGGCAGGVLFHLLDWHRRLARKRRLFSPRRLLPSSVRGYSPRRLPPPPSPAPPPRLAPHGATTRADGNAAPGVVARLMGLESWPAAAAPRPQKQRKVDAASAASSVVLVLPPGRHPPSSAPAPAHAPRSHHSADLPARSPRRSRLVHTAAAKLLEPGARASSRTRLALAYACSSPQHRKDAVAGHMLDDFLSRSGSLPLDRPTPPALPEDTERGSARWHPHQSAINTMSNTAAADVVINSSNTEVVPRTHFDDANTRRGSSDVDATRGDHRARAERMGNHDRIGLNNVGPGARIREGRLSRKRENFSRPDVSRSVGYGNLVGSTRPSGGDDRILATGSSRRAAPNCSGPRRESMGSITLQRSTGRSMIDRSGLASTSKNTSNASGPRRGSGKKVDHGTSASSRKNCSQVAFASCSLARPVSRALSHNKVSEKRRFPRTHSDTTCARMPVVDARCLEAEPSVADTSETEEFSKFFAFASSSSARSVSRALSHSKVSEKRGFPRTHSDADCARIPVVDARCLEAEPSVADTSEKEEFSRLLKAKMDELGLSDRIEPSDAHSGNLTVSVLQGLISALTNDTNTSASQSSINSDSSDPINNTETIYSCNNQSPDFQRCYQDDHEADSSATCTNNEPNQPSPTSILEACFSNDNSSSGSPAEKIEGKDFLSVENKMENLFNLESDIVELAMSTDTKEIDAIGNGEILCVQNFASLNFKFLEASLHVIGEAISNAELLLGSSLLCNTQSNPQLHSFITEMLEIVESFCGRSEGLGLTEEKKYQRTSFLFDCIAESLNSKFCDFGKCGYRAWLRLPLTLSKDLLKREISEEISSWMKPSEISSNRIAEKELDQLTARPEACQVEEFDISVAIEEDIFAELVDELAFDQW